MYSKRRSMDEQFKLIMECRNSGMSDSQWCRENDIKPSTFYTWIQRIRERGGYDIPEPAFKPVVLDKPDVVKIDVIPDFTAGPAVVHTAPTVQMREMEHFTPVMEISFANASVKLTNNTSPELLSAIMSYLAGGTYDR